MNKTVNDSYKYCIFGGSFDPIHLGHVRLADVAVKQLNLDKLYLMPAYVSPFKQDKNVTDANDRVAMVEAASKFNDKFEVSTYEVHNPEPSYTIETLEYFSNMIDGDLYFTLGYDSVMTLDTWYRGPEILSNYHLVTARRPGIDDAEADAKIAYYEEKYGAHIHILDMEPFDVSSTEIRERAANGLSLQGLVLPEVEEYIKKHGLYR